MNEEPNTLIGSTIFLGWTPGERHAVVSNGLIVAIKDGPVTAVIQRETASRLVVDWEVEDVVNKALQRTPEVRYRATLDRKSNGIRVKVRVVDYPNSFHAGGTCVPAKRERPKR